MQCCLLLNYHSLFELQMMSESNGFNTFRDIRLNTCVSLMLSSHVVVKSKIVQN